MKVQLAHAMTREELDAWKSFPHDYGHIKSPIYVPPARQARLIRDIRKWCQRTPKSFWPDWLQDPKLKALGKHIGADDDVGAVPGVAEG